MSCGNRSRGKCDPTRVTEDTNISTSEVANTHTFVDAPEFDTYSDATSMGLWLSEDVFDRNTSVLAQVTYAVVDDDGVETLVNLSPVNITSAKDTITDQTLRRRQKHLYKCLGTLPNTFERLVQLTVNFTPIGDSTEWSMTYAYRVTRYLNGKNSSCSRMI